MIKQCLICGSTYDAITPNSKYCCLECMATAKKINRKKWEYKHQEYNKIYARERRRKEKELSAFSHNI